LATFSRSSIICGPEKLFCKRQPADRVALARREHAFLLREAGLAELLRSEGWEDVVASLQAQLAAARAAAEAAERAARGR
jgi:hypothetical protein